MEYVPRSVINVKIGQELMDSVLAAIQDMEFQSMEFVVLLVVAQELVLVHQILILIVNASMMIRHAKHAMLAIILFLLFVHQLLSVHHQLTPAINMNIKIQKENGLVIGLKDVNRFALIVLTDTI